MLRRALPVLLVCLAACDKPANDPLARDFAVVKAALANTCQSPESSRMVVADEPVDYSDHGIPNDWSHAADYSREFKRRAKETSRWPIGEICTNARVVSQQAIDAEFAKDQRIPPGWEGFHTTFGATGLNAYSRPAYSRDGKHAALYVDTHCGVGCGMGLLLELELTDAGWKVVRAVGAWLS